MTRAAVIAGLCVGLCAATAHAEDGPSPWAVSLEAGARWHLDAGWDAVSSAEAVPFGGVGVARDLTPSNGRFVLAVDAGYTYAAGARRLYARWDAVGKEHAMLAGVSLRVRALSWLLPYARLSAGAMYTAVRFDDGAQALDADGWAPLGGAGLGVTLQTGELFPTGGGRAGRFAFSVEGGMLLAPSQTFTANPRAPSDETLANDRLPTTGVRLGDLNNSAPYLRVSAAFRF